MKSIESSGKTVKDAINQGAKELGCDPSDLEIEVLEMGSPGLFGMFGRLARVKLTLKEAEDEFEIDIPEMTIDQPAQKAARSRRREEKPKAKSAPAPQEAAQEQPAEKEKSSRKSRSRARKESDPAPVSYTHLDVYKRQVSHRLAVQRGRLLCGELHVGQHRIKNFGLFYMRYI